MASKKTKLIQDQRAAPDIEVLDLGQVDDMFDMGGTKYKSQGVLRDFQAGLKQGVMGIDGAKGRARAKGILHNFARSMLPDSVNRTIGLLDAGRGLLTDVVKEVERTRPGDLASIAKEARDMLPHLKGKVSEQMYQRLDSGTSQKIEQYRYQQDANRSQNILYKRMKAQRAQREQDEADIKAALDQNTLVEQRLHEISEQREDRRFQVAQTERGLRDQVTAKRYDFMSRAMSIAADGISRMANYEEQIGYGLARKSLELQMRTYMGIRDLLEVSKTQLELHDRGYTALVKNTGTPDHLKSSMKELVNFNMSQRASDNITQKLIKGLPAYLGTYGDQIRANITKKVGMGIQGLSMFLTTGSILPEDAWDKRYELAGSFGGSAAADWIKDRIAPRFGRKLRPMVEKYFDEKAAGGHNHLSYLLDNAPQLAQEWVNDAKNSYGWRGKLQGVLKGILPQYRQDDALKDNTYQTIDKGAEFTQMTQRSIVDIIPGLLARQLRELTNIRRGTDDAPLIRYDITTGKFAEDSQALKNLSDAVVGRNTSKNISAAIDETINKYDDQGELSEKARKALAATLMRDAATNRSFDPSRYVKTRFKDAPDDETNAELQGFFKSKFQWTDKGTMAFNAENNRRLNEFSKAFLNIRMITADPFGEIERIVKSGNSEALRILGIIYTERGEDRINYERLWEIMRGDAGGPDPYTGERRTGGPGNPFGPPPPGGPGDDPMGGFGAFFNNMRNRAQGAFGGGAPNQATVDAMREAMRGAMEDVFGRASAAGASARGFASGFTDQARNAGERATSAFHAAAEKMGGGSKGMPDNPICDLYVDGTERVVVRAVDIVAGELIDVNTGRVVTGVKDITGRVVNRHGDEIVTEVEASVGLSNLQGLVLVRTEKTLEGEFLGGAGKGTGLTPWVEKVGETYENKFDVDWYIEGREKPLLLGRDIRDGEYLDQNSGKVIAKPEDITGPIVDREGNVVATIDELKEKLYNPTTGHVLKLGKLIAALVNLFFGKGTLGQRAWNLTKNVLGKTGSVVWGAVKKITDSFIGNQDAYVPDTDTPIVTGYGLRRGDYYDKKGEVITSFRDHYGPIYNAQGQVIVTDEQRKDLLNVDGTQHDLSKKWKIGRAFAQTYMKWTKRYYKWLGKKVSPLGKWAGGKVGGLINGLSDYGKLETPTEQLLAGILDTLRERLSVPKRANRKGSWEEKYEKATERDKDGDGVDDQEESDNRQGGLISKGLMALGDKLRYRTKDEGDDDGEESDEDGNPITDALSTAADIANIKNGVAGGGRKGRKGKKVSRAGPKKGLLRRAAGAVWNLGKGAVSIGFGASLRAAGFFTAAALGTIGTGLMAALTSPITLGVAAVASVGYGAYKLHGWWKTKGELRDYRLMQYGAESTSERKRCVELEAFLEPKLDKSNGYALKLKPEDLKTMCDIMDLKMENQFGFSGIGFANKAGIFAFSKWLDLRFRPVFTKAIQAMDVAKLQGESLSEIDGKIPDELKYAYLEAAKLPFEGESSPYAFTASPFGDPEEEVSITLEQIRTRYEELVIKYKKEVKDEEKDGIKTTDTASAAAVAKTAKAIGKGALKTPAQPGDGSLIKANATRPGDPVGVMKPGAKVPVGSQAVNGAMKSFIPPTTAKVLKASLTASIGSVAREGMPTGGLTKLTSLQAVRFRAYGLETTTITDAEALLSLEAYYFNNCKVDQDGEVTFTGNMDALLEKMSSLFGIPMGEGPKRERLIHWFRGRFDPVFQTYLGALKRQMGNINLARVEGQLKPPQKFQTANAILGATNPNGDLWETESIFDVRGMLSALKTLAETEAKVLQQEADKYVAETPAMTPAQQQAAKTNADSGQGFSAAGLLSAVKETAKSAWDSTKNAVSRAYTSVSDTVMSTGASIASAMSGDAGTMQTKGTTFSGLTAGNGGAWTEIPMPTKNKDRAAAMPTLRKVSEMVGIPAELMAIFVSIESGFDARAFAGKFDPKATASGWFQFINSTWDGMITKFWKKYGLPDPSGDPKREMRWDPRINALMGAEFMKESYGILKKRLGREPSDVDLYAAHFFGPVTAAKFLQADPNIIGEKMFPEQARANPGIFRVKGGAPRTLGQIYALFDSKIAPHRGQGGVDTAKAAPGKEEVQKSAIEQDVQKNGAGDEDTAKSAAAEKSESKAGMTPTPLASTAASTSPGPSATGSTPTNTGSGPQQNYPLKMPTPGDVSATPDASQQPPAPDTAQPNAASQSLRSAEAQDRLTAARHVKTMQANKEMAEIAREQLEVLKRIEALMQTGRGNNMTSPPASTQPQGRQANPMAAPVPLR